MIKFFNKKSGSGYLIVIGFTSIMLILFLIIGQMNSGQQLLQSKNTRKYLATTLGETALNCIITELNLNRSFATHWYYQNDSGNPKWKDPRKQRESNLGDMGKIYVEGVKNGVYYGGSDIGEFKARFAPIYNAREGRKTETLLEKELYEHVEIVVKTGTGSGEKNNTYYKILAKLERRNPGAEHLLFDGELLDVGALGPYIGRENPLRRGRLYGYQFITFNTAGGADRGSELFKMEKIETPGFIRAIKSARIEFANRKKMHLSVKNDSSKISKFNTYDGYILDGAHGAHPIKLTRLPRERFKEKAIRYRKSYGVLIKKGDLEYSKYKNPYNKSDKYVDLDFGEYRCKRKDSSSSSSAPVDPDASEAGSSTESKGSDDPKIICERKSGKRILVYSEEPLRIWGNPDRSITIYSEKDIVVAGDFNQNINAVQDYKTDDFLDYETEIKNGKGFDKVGALLMAEGRILIDMSQPAKFVKNEMKPYFLYWLGMSLNPYSDAQEKELKDNFCPRDPDKRTGIVGSGSEGPDGYPVPKFGTIAWLHKSQNVTSGPAYEANISDLRSFFTPGGGERPRFVINDASAREEVINLVTKFCREGGDLTRDECDKIFEKAWKQAVIEEENSPSISSGAMGMIKGLFETAKEDLKDGIFMPEITINASLISSEKRGSKWRIGNSSEKIRDEMGNYGAREYLRKPAFLIQRIFGSEIRIANNEPRYFISKSLAGNSILRRRVWDKTNLKNQKFRPVEFPNTYNILTYTEEKISGKEFDRFEKNGE